MKVNILLRIGDPDTVPPETLVNQESKATFDLRFNKTVTDKEIDPEKKCGLFEIIE